MRPRSIIALTAAATSTTVAIGSIGLVHRESAPNIPAPLTRILPLAGFALVAGYVAHIPLPKFVRAPIFEAYGNYVGCDLSAVAEPLDSYRSLGAFQARKLSAAARPIDESSQVVAPADGVIEAMGRVAAFGSLSLKGQRVSIPELLASDPRERLADVAVNVLTEGEGGNEVSQFGTEERGLWYVVVKMSPRHAHSFASPCDWAVSRARRVSGSLKWLSAGALTENERLSLVGTWDSGAFCMAAIGAPGWGTIVLNKNSTETVWKRDGTRRRSSTVGKVEDLGYIRPRLLEKGEPLGCFQMGSAIALVFEAPVGGFKFYAKEGEEIQTGQPLASFSTTAKISSSQLSDRDVPKSQDNFKSSSRKQFKRAW